jgi:hypothetical protein
MNKATDLEKAMRKNPTLLNLVSRLSLSFTDHETGEFLNTKQDFINFQTKKNNYIMGKFAKNAAKDAEKEVKNKPEEKASEIAAPPPGFDAAVSGAPKRNFYKFGEAPDSLKCILVDVEEIDFKDGKGNVPVVVCEVEGVGEMLLPTHTDLIRKCEAVFEEYGTGHVVHIQFDGKHPHPTDKNKSLARYTVYPAAKKK